MTASTPGSDTSAATSSSGAPSIGSIRWTPSGVATWARHGDGRVGALPEEFEVDGRAPRGARLGVDGGDAGGVADRLGRGHPSLP